MAYLRVPRIALDILEEHGLTGFYYPPNIPLTSTKDPRSNKERWVGFIGSTQMDLVPLGIEEKNPCRIKMKNLSDLLDDLLQYGVWAPAWR